MHLLGSNQVILQKLLLYSHVRVRNQFWNAMLMEKLTIASLFMMLFLES